MRRFFEEDSGMDFATLIALGSAYRGLADAGEVLATIERIPDGDREAWVREFSGLADRLRLAAEQSEKAGHQVSARTAYLRASLYYDHASAMAPGTSDPDRFTALWEHHRDCWDRSLPYWNISVDKIAIPYEGTTLEGYWFRPPGDTTTRRPTVILNNGSDGPVIAMWTQGGAAAIDRGWNAVTFDGPGQGAALHRDKMWFRADWEAVITPVVDYLQARDDVDPDRIVLHGISQGGYWCPRAAAFEHRLAALVADPGCIDVSTALTDHLPPEMKAMLDDPANKDDFDAAMGFVPPELLSVVKWKILPYGTTSPFEGYRGAMEMRLDDATIAQIECPTLVTDPDNEQFWPGQSQALYDKLTCEKALVRFTTAEGADWHCEVAAQSLRDERVFDWLESILQR
jgi:hypothetical protein